MDVNRDTCRLIAELEYRIGSECYNPHSYDSWNEVEGCSFRYPVSIRNSKGEFVKIRGNLNRTPLLKQTEITPESIRFMKYKLGANELFIGKGIVEMLQYLEDRYHLNFNELEAKSVKEKREVR